MNQARTTYRDDFVPYAWGEDGFTINNETFCTQDNIDECMKYISQEFCALGYPSIYSSSNSCPYSINCDIVKYLNATFEVLKDCHQHVKVREDLENRNQRLSSDLSHLNKKNASLKRSLGEVERKLASALERERELKVKNEELMQLLKSEKDEVRKLSIQAQRQKTAYQHEAKKQEATMNQMRSKINQLLSDKNPSKKVASISPSYALQRNGTQRAKWQTGMVAKSSLEEMYNSVISSYESRCKDTAEEYYNFMEYIKSQLIEMISILQNDKSDVNLNPAIDIQSCGRSAQRLKGYLKSLICKAKECAQQNAKLIDTKQSDELVDLKSKLCEYEKIIESYKESEQATNCGTQEAEDNKIKQQADAERNNLLKEKKALEEMSAYIEKKKADVEAQKLDLIKFTLQQKVPTSKWHQGLKTCSSVCVITTRNGMTAIPNTNQLKLCLSAPDELEKILDPLWKSEDQKVKRDGHSKSAEAFSTQNIQEKAENLGSSQTTYTGLDNSDLPSWAVENCQEKRIEISEMHDETCNPSATKDETAICVAISTSSNELLDESSCEDSNFSRLKAAVEDIEKRRNVLSPTM